MYIFYYIENKKKMIFYNKENGLFSSIQGEMNDGKKKLYKINK